MWSQSNLSIILLSVILVYCLLVIIFGCHKERGRRIGEERRKNLTDVRNEVK